MPKPWSVVVFTPRRGMLKWYVRNAHEMGVEPLQCGDTGLVRGASAENQHGLRELVVVEGTRTGRFHEIECGDLKVKTTSKRSR